MSFKTFSAALTTAFAILLSACQSSEKMPPPNLEDAAMAWGKCRTQFMQVKLKTDLSAQQLSDQALAFCQPFEVTFMEAGSAENGSGWNAVEQHKLAREAMIQRVDEIRSGQPASNPFIAWGNCTGRQLQIEKASRDPIQSSVERIMAKCRTYENTVLADATKKFGQAAGKQVLSESAPKIRHILETQLQQARSQSGSN